jgi:hypothetical protein
MNHFNDHLNYCNNIHDNLFVRNQVQYYKDLSEHLEVKCRRLLNEVESQFELSLGQGAGSVEGDPNYRHIQVSPINYTAICNVSGQNCHYVKSLDDSLLSIKDQLAPVNTSTKVWLSLIGGNNNVGSLLNQFYQNWNNLNWWNSVDVKRFYLMLARPWQLAEYNNYGATVTVNWTEDLKKSVFAAFTGALEHGANAANQLINNYNFNLGSTNLRAHVNQSLEAYWRANGWPSAQPSKLANNPVALNYSSFAPNVGTGFAGNNQYLLNNPGYFLPGLGNLSNINPWQWNPSMGLPYPSSSNAGNVQGSNQPSGAAKMDLENFNTTGIPSKRRFKK